MKDEAPSVRAGAGTSRRRNRSSLTTTGSGLRAAVPLPAGHGCGIAVLTLATLAVAGFFLLQRKLASTLYLLVAVGGGLLLSSVAKNLFDRPRPNLVPYGLIVHAASFPSGHSMLAAVVYLTLGVLVARALAQRRLKVYVLSLATLVMILVGVSRVYLGVNWPTDVLAGWLAGVAWACLCMLGARWLARRGDVEPEALEEP